MRSAKKVSNVETSLGKWLGSSSRIGASAVCDSRIEGVTSIRLVQMPKCEDKMGFLFRHPCDRTAVGKCEICDRAVCKLHLSELDGRPICASCKSEQLQRDDTTDDNGVGNAAHYSYGWYYYSGYHYGGHPFADIDSREDDREYSTYNESSQSDPDDFTEGDAESFEEPGDEAFFETDLSES